MTIKIIERGIDPKGKVYRTTCSHCHSVLEFMAEDAKSQFDRNESFKAIVCPVCQSEIWCKA